mmetsp:Transcript_9348/g.14166  ORF Transcript_9348/g.14166 Transcript_9348/m.14166 type:complete len:88 (+) Transcript_9348:1641-1904(+)
MPTVNSQPQTMSGPGFQAPQQFPSDGFRMNSQNFMHYNTQSEPAQQWSSMGTPVPGDLNNRMNSLKTKLDKEPESGADKSSDLMAQF